MSRDKTNRLYAKDCPKCGHSALEHKHGRPGEVPRTMSGPPVWVRNCRHAVPLEGKQGIFTFCQCQIDEEDYAQLENYAVIRAR
jgi:hypothetical protein